MPPNLDRPAASRTALFAIILLGGPAVLASYAHGISNPPANGSIWGGVPASLQPVYTASMLLAALGFFPFTTLIAFKTDPTTARIGKLGYGVFAPLYALVLGCSAAWLPLTAQVLDAPTLMGWWMVRGVLFGAALGSLGLLLAILKLRPQAGRTLRIAAVAGAVAFCWQTVVLDALVWPAYFPS